MIVSGWNQNSDFGLSLDGVKSYVTIKYSQVTYLARFEAQKSTK